jgi:hypothetical protein
MAPRGTIYDRDGNLLDDDDDIVPDGGMLRMPLP